jgi:hypothetical protein
MAHSAAAGRRAWPLVAAGAVVGLTWAAALRGWMIHMAGGASAFHWYGTFALVLAPGLLIGGLLGLAEHRRRTGGSRSLWLTLSPSLFLAALADPAMFKALITQGLGGGAIGVVMFGLAGGHALAGRGRAWWRRTCGVIAVLGILLLARLRHPATDRPGRARSRRLDRDGRMRRVRPCLGGRIARVHVAGGG